MTQANENIVYGLELDEKYLYLCRMRTDAKNKPLVEDLKKIEIPSKLVLPNGLTDIEVLANHLRSVFGVEKIEGKNIIVAINRVKFFSNIERTGLINKEEMQRHIELSLDSVHQFKSAEFSYGMQVYPRFVGTQTEKNHKGNVVLYAAINQSIINNIIDLVEILGMNLVAIDLVPLAMLRALFWIPKEEELAGNIIIDRGHVTFSVLEEGNIIYSKLIKRKEDAELNEELLRKIQYVMLCFYDMYPKSKGLQNISVFSRLDNKQEIIEKLNEKLPNYTWIEAKYEDQIEISPELSKKIAKESSAVYLGAIGLSLKYYEKYNKTLSLIKTRREVGPIVNKKQISVALIGMGLVLLLFYFINTYLEVAINKNQRILEQMKQTIKRRQRGEDVAGANILELLKDKKRYFSNLQKKDVKQYEFLTTLVSIVPVDMELERLNVKNNEKVMIKGNGYSQDSIADFYAKLQRRYKEVELNGIVIKKTGEGLMTNSFIMNFKKNKANGFK
jgi:Tfp pilus assembly PilM family ATPase